MLNSPSSHSRDKRIYFCYKEWVFAIPVSGFWVRDMIFSLKTKRAVCMLNYLGESALMSAIYFIFIIYLFI